MDGNGRWAKSRGLPRVRGHQAGVESIRDTIEACVEWGIRYVTLYSFSTENWERPRAEVEFLMRLLKRYLREEVNMLVENNIRLRTIGFIEDLPRGIQRDLAKTKEITAENTALDLILALSYGSRSEILQAVRGLMRDATEGRIDIDDVDVELFSSRLHTASFPDPDLLIRTSGEMRLSNFLLWQAAYTELWVTPVLWPDFRRDELYRGLEAYAARDRRFGKVQE